MTRCSKLPTSLVTVLVCWTIRACADDPLLALLEARDEQQNALSHAISGTTAAAHSSKDFTYQLQQDKDPAELLANTDLPELTSQQLISTNQASTAIDIPKGTSAASTARPGRDRHYQYGPASILIRGSGLDRQTGNQLGVAALKRRIEELNRWVQLLRPLMLMLRRFLLLETDMTAQSVPKCFLPSTALGTYHQLI